LLAPNPYVKAWVQEQLEAQINALVHMLSQGLIERVIIEVGTKDIEVVEATPAPVETLSESSANKSTEPSPIAEPAVGSPINPLFTFDSYVEGKSNQIA